jgi:hypothetical protein
MNSCIPVLAGAALMTACGGSATMAASDAGEDALTCQEVAFIPDAAVYMCEAGPPGAVGCPVSGLDPNAAGNSNLYPEGCSVTLPRRSTFCGPIGCTCQQLSFGDAGLQFICPL